MNHFYQVKNDSPIIKDYYAPFKIGKVKYTKRRISPRRKIRKLNEVRVGIHFSSNVKEFKENSESDVSL